MSVIENNASNTFPLLVAIREQLEHRALWLYLLVDEAEKHGLNPEEFAPDAIKRCGVYQGGGIVEKSGTQSLKGLKKVLFTKAAQEVFEMDIRECTDDALSIDFHYCPLVKAWQKQGCSDEQIEHLCDIAMCGDRGIAEAHGCVLELPKTIAKGDEICEIRFKRAPKLTRRERAKKEREQKKAQRKELKQQEKQEQKAARKTSKKQLKDIRKDAKKTARKERWSWWPFGRKLRKPAFRLPDGEMEAQAAAAQTATPENEDNAAMNATSATAATTATSAATEKQK